jgi:hypothetical protein
MSSSSSSPSSSPRQPGGSDRLDDRERARALEILEKERNDAERMVETLRKTVRTLEVAKGKAEAEAAQLLKEGAQIYKMPFFFGIPNVDSFQKQAFPPHGPFPSI